MTRAYAAAAVETPATPERLFEVLTDWPRHREWMFGTSAEVIEGDGHGVGARIAAFTGFGPLGFLDTMRVTRWEPPHRLDMLHTGRVVRGVGVIRIKALSGGGSRIIWAEELELPPGAGLVWPLIQPVAAALARSSLLKLAELAR